MSTSNIQIHNVVACTVNPPCTTLDTDQSMRTQYPFPLCNAQCSPGPYYTLIMYGQCYCNSRAAEVGSFIKSGDDSVCDAIHITHDIHFSRRQKSDVSTAEATGVLLVCYLIVNE